MWEVNLQDNLYLYIGQQGLFGNSGIPAPRVTRNTQKHI